MDQIFKLAGNFLAGNNPHAATFFNRVSIMVNGNWSQDNVARALSSIAQSEDGVNDIYNFIQSADSNNMLLSIISQIKNTSVTDLKFLTKNDLRNLFSQYANFHQVRRETAFFPSSTNIKIESINQKNEKDISSKMVFAVVYVLRECLESRQNDRLVSLIIMHPESEMLHAIINSYSNSYPSEISQQNPIRHISTAEAIIQNLGDEQINSIFSYMSKYGIPGLDI